MPGRRQPWNARTTSGIERFTLIAALLVAKETNDRDHRSENDQPPSTLPHAVSLALGAAPPWDGRPGTTPLADVGSGTPARSGSRRRRTPGGPGLGRLYDRIRSRGLSRG